MSQHLYTRGGSPGAGPGGTEPTTDGQKEEKGKEGVIDAEFEVKK